MKKYIFIVFLLYQMISCSQKIPFDKTEKNNTYIQQARELVGTPYKVSGKTKSGFDCSGLIYYIFQENNIQIPRSSSAQANYFKKISQKEILTGDLVFFKNKSKINHVGIISQLKKDSIFIIHASSSKGVIEEEILTSNYWKSKISHFGENKNKVH